MRNMWHLFRTDWINIVRVPTGIFLIVAIILIPGVYDWVNIKSVWDPYKNTEGILIAVTSLDQGAEIEDNTINIGEELLHNLKNNTKLGWTFVDETEAHRGVEKGTYYASLLISADFTARLTGIIEGKLDRPEVIYTVNEKVNAIAPKITGSGVSAITKQINESFTEAVSEAILTKLSEVNIELQAELPTIRKIKSGIFTLESNLPKIQEAGQKVLEVESMLPEITEKAQKLIVIEGMLPEINEAAQYVLKLQQYWPQISDAASEVLVIQQKLPQIQEAANLIQGVDENFDRVTRAIEEALVKTNKALEIVTAAEDQLTKVENMTTSAVQLANEVDRFFASNKEAFQSIAPAIKQNLMLLAQIADTVNLVSSKLMNADLDSLPSVEQVDNVSHLLATASSATEQMENLLGKINSPLPDKPLNDPIKRLNSISTKLKKQMDWLSTAKKAIGNNQIPSTEVVEGLNTTSKGVISGIDQLLAGYDSELAPAINQSLAKLQTGASVSAEALQIAEGRLPDISNILKSAKQVIEFGQTELLRIQAEIPESRAKVHEIAEALQRKTAAFAKGINTVAPFVRNDLPKIGGKIDAAASFVQHGLPETEAELAKVTNFIRYQLPEVENGVHRVAGLVRDDLPQLKKAISKAATKLREVEGNDNFSELAKLLRGDIQKESEFLASPVQIIEKELYPIPNYGSGMSPFYGVLSLWVGATLLISLLRAEADNPTGHIRGYELYLGRMATFLSIGWMQALCVSIGDIIFLHAYVADKLWFILFAMLVSAVFVAITYMLLSVFGNAGKGIAIIFMVFQFTSSGGTFPISMTSPFFRAINPFMPFTYAISLLREAVGGILWETAIKDIVFLFGFIAISLFIALVLKRPLSGITKRSSDNAKKTKIIA